MFQISDVIKIMTQAVNSQAVGNVISLSLFCLV